MSDDELENIRKKRLEELKKQAMEQQQRQEIQRQQKEQVDQQKNAILRLVLSSDARVRLQNLRMARKDFAEAIEYQLIQLYSQGTLQRAYNLPLSDEDFKNLLARAQGKNKHNSKIRIL